MIFAGLLLTLEITEAQSYSDLAISNSPSFLYSNLNLKRTALLDNEVGSRVIRSFTRSFKNISSIHWFRLKNTYYLVEFDLNGRKSKALYEKNGGMIYSISSGFKNSLPRDLLRTLRAAYLDYTIGIVNEVYSNNEKAWIINLEDAETVVIARVMNGELVELAHYKNAGKSR